MGDENDGAVGKFQRVVMLVWLVEVYLAKPRQPITDFPPKYDALGSNVILECEFGPGTKADRDLRVVRARKAPSRRGLKFGRNQRFRNLSGPRCDRMQAVIAHGTLPSMATQPITNLRKPIWLQQRQKRPLSASWQANAALRGLAVRGRMMEKDIGEHAFGLRGRDFQAKAVPV
jgi:hypothetical protein